MDACTPKPLQTHSQKYRARKRAKDEPGYLKHNAKVMREWRRTHKEEWARWCANDPNYRLTGIRREGVKKGYGWGADMTDEVCYAMMKSGCFYCDFTSPDYLNGIDRLDNTVGYVLSNSVRCCKFCNFMKTCLDPTTFVERCVHIASCQGSGAEKFPSAWGDRLPASFWSYKDRAKKKGLPFEISREQFDKFRLTPCRYCQRAVDAMNKSGVDRVDNALGYTMSNCVACCSECNLMKRHRSHDEFMSTIFRVANKAPTLQFPPGISRCYRVITKRTVKTPAPVHPRTRLPGNGKKKAGTS